MAIRIDILYTKLGSGAMRVTTTDLEPPLLASPKQPITSHQESGQQLAPASRTTRGLRYGKKYATMRSTWPYLYSEGAMLLGDERGALQKSSGQDKAQFRARASVRLVACTVAYQSTLSSYPTAVDRRRIRRHRSTRHPYLRPPDATLRHECTHRKKAHLKPSTVRQ